MEACRALTRRHEDHPSMPSAGRATKRLLKVEGQERRRGARALGRVERQGRRGGQSCVIAHRALACNPHITCKHTPAHTGNY